MKTFRCTRWLLCLALAGMMGNVLGNPLTLDAAAIKQAGIAVDKLTRRALTEEIKAPGEVKADAYSTVLVTPRIEAQVLSRTAKLGDLIKAGDLLVTLSSVEVAGVQGELIVAEQDWQRVASLGPQAVSGRRYYEAKVLRDQARAKLRAYGVSDAQIARLLKAGSTQADGSFELVAPAAGRVTTDDFLVGQRVEPGKVLFTLAKEDAVWVEAQVPPSQRDRIKFDSAARILVHDTEMPGRVIQTSHQSDEHTRTVAVRIRVDNSQDLLHPGELVDARLSIGQASPRLAVPAEAVVLLQNQATVFVAKGANNFEPVSVKLGSTRGNWVEITEGLAEGTLYVSKGAFALKARLLRSQLGED
jgi:cobalt-zinc-cadmium efflux system membrane fusion protein